MGRLSGTDRTDSAGKEPGLSIVAAGMRITGELDTNGVVKVEGVVAGSVRAERQVLVAKGGVVEGDILTREAIIGGEVRGMIFADERVEVQTTSQIHGDITTKRILLQEGGEVNGHLKMEDPKALDRDLQAHRRAAAASQEEAAVAPDIPVASPAEAIPASTGEADSSVDRSAPAPAAPPSELHDGPSIRHIGGPRV